MSQNENPHPGAKFRTTFSANPSVGVCYSAHFRHHVFASPSEGRFLGAKFRTRVRRCAMPRTTLKPLWLKDLRRKKWLLVRFSLLGEFTFGILARIHFVTEDHFGRTRHRISHHGVSDDYSENLLDKLLVML